MLDEYQQRAVQAREKRILVLAGAGSGKTRVLVNRVLHLRDSGMPLSQLCAVTFSKEAARQMEDRLVPETSGFLPNTGTTGGMQIGTIHALGYKILRAEIPGRTVADRGHSKRLLRKAITQAGCREKYAEVANAVFKAKREMQPCPRPFASVLQIYTDLLRQGRVWDFDDLLVQAIRVLEDRDRAAGAKWKGAFEEILLDEVQDTSRVQWRLLRALIAPDTRLFLVGDMAQCHPPGVTVQVANRRDPEGTTQAVESIVAGTRVRAWNRHAQKMVSGRRVEKTGVRMFEGELCDVAVRGRVVPVTPNHRFLARWMNRAEEIHLTYLMWREGYGFRVGWCRLFNLDSHGFHLGHRSRMEKADRTWILQVHRDRTAASIAESIIGTRYGLPFMPFEPPHDAIHYTAEPLREFWDAVAGTNAKRGHHALCDHGLDFDLPLYPWPGGEIAKKGRPTYFECYAANLLPNLMALPLPDGPNVWAPIEAVHRRAYSGPVYSLEVEQDHSYVANGIVTLNSVYSFRGADPGVVAEVERDLGPFTRYELPVNYRSRPQVIALANRVLASHPGGIVLQPTRDAGEYTPVVAQLPVAGSAFQEGKEIAAALQQAKAAGLIDAWDEAAVLVRVNAATEPIETALAEAGVPAIVMGGVGFYGRSEVQDVLAYLRLVETWDYDALGRIFNRPARYLGAVFLRELEQQGGWPALVAGQARFGPRYQRGVDHLLHDIRMLRQWSYKTGRNHPGAAVRAVLRDLKYEHWCLGETPASGQEESDAAEALRDVFVSLVNAADRWRTVGEFLALADLCARRSRGAALGRVRISTVHRFKGLEAPLVVIAAMDEGVMPHKRGNKDEERRIFYVAVTRARDMLLLSATHPSLFFRECAQHVGPARQLLAAGGLDDGTGDHGDRPGDSVAEGHPRGGTQALDQRGGNGAHAPGHDAGGSGGPVLDGVGARWAPDW